MQRGKPSWLALLFGAAASRDGPEPWRFEIPDIFCVSLA